MSDTEQARAWSSGFGHEYTGRNPQNSGEVNASYMQKYGGSRSDMNEEFMRNLDRTLRVLEVGTNVGTQLQILEEAGFQNLYGIELQKYAYRRPDNSFLMQT